MPRIALATSRAFPDLQPGEVLLAEALAARGVDAAVAPWNAGFAPFAAADLVVVRSTWDYPQSPEMFRAWLGRLAREARRVVNPPGLMAWNLSKEYLFDLAARGAPLPATRLADPEPAALAAAMTALGVEEAVVKPAIGAGAGGLSRVRLADAEGLARAAAALGGPGLVQGVIGEIAARGETSMVFFSGRFSHAVVKRPAAGDIRSQVQHGALISPVAAPDWAVADAEKVLGLLPEAPLYARVDAVLLDGRMALMEVEVIEPDLFLTHDEGAAARFADALVEKLRA